MESGLTLHKVKSIRRRKILNSHMAFTNEFEVKLDNGNVGIGSSSQGETISIYEIDSARSETQDITEDITRGGSIEAPISQEGFDRFLHERECRYGRNNCWALSLAFFNAAGPSAKYGTGWTTDHFPRLCLNVLNGGQHAYTNPVLSDLPEYLVVPQFDDIGQVIRHHAEIQEEVRRELASCERVMVNNNMVHRFEKKDNRECVALIQRVLDRLGLSGRYDMMIDASAGDLWNGKSYSFSLTDGSKRSTEELKSYWQRLIDEFDIGLLEDPFTEKDFHGWRALTGEQTGCRTIGDNLYASDATRIEQGARDGLTHGVIIKPNQAGTITSVRKAVMTAHKMGQLPITSHRSISTESIYLSLLTVMEKVRYMKIGPLNTDYSSTMRLNELIRLTGVDVA